MRQFLRGSALALVIALGLATGLTTSVTPLTGCAAMQQADPTSQTYLAAESYKTMQLAIEALVLSPTTDANLKTTLKNIDLEANSALRAMRDAAASGNSDKVVFYSNALANLLIQLRPHLAKAVKP